MTLSSRAKALVRSTAAGRALIGFVRGTPAAPEAVAEPTPADEDPVTVVHLPAELRAGTTLRMYRLEGRDQVARALHAGGWGAFEPPLPSVVARLMAASGGTLLDVGANTGLYSLIAVTARADATAIAFEPVPDIVGLLRANIDLNDVGGRIVVDEVAIGDVTGTTLLHLPPPQADGTIETSASLEPDFKEVIETTMTIASSTLDDSWASHGRPAVTMVKIDVEGAEARVLRGATELVRACRPVLSVEVLGRLDSAPLESMRAELGYVDVVLGIDRAIIGRAEVAVDADAPNHLLVAPEAIDGVAHELRAIPGLSVVHEG